MNQLNNLWKPEVVKWWTENDIEMPTIGADPLNRLAEEDVLIWPLRDNQLEGWTTVTERANNSPDAKGPGSISRSSNHCYFLLIFPTKAQKVQGHPTGH